VPVAEHHDGFAMYNTDRSRWKAAAMGPQRDVIGDLAEASRHQSLVFGASSHRAEHWWFMNGGTRFPSDVLDPESADLYGPAQSEAMQPNDGFLIDWFLRTIEIIDKYEPQVLWFDSWIEQPAFEPWLRQHRVGVRSATARPLPACAGSGVGSPPLSCLASSEPGSPNVINHRIITDDGPVLASTVTHLLAVVAVILGALVLGEPITLQLAAGVAVVLTGIALTRRTSRDPAAAEPRVLRQ
jgi:hypothetical protein